MTEVAQSEVKEIVDRETRAWDERSVPLLLSIFHPDMVWVWPTDSKNLDPMSWATIMGKFDESRWSETYRKWFGTFELRHNLRQTRKIEVSSQGDGAFAVVDIDTLWESPSGDRSHWFGRTCKTYVRTANGWKMIAQTGVFDPSRL